MKTKHILFAFAAVITLAVNAQQSNEELINLLIQKNVISQNDADSLRAENAIKGQQEKEKQNKFSLFSSKQLTLNGYTQIRFLSLQEAGKPDAIDIRRARLDLKGVINPHWDYRLQLDFAGTPKILDATINYKYRDWLKFSAGQFKIPFSAENITQSNRLETIDRAQAVEALVARGKDVIGNQNGRDIGIQLSGSLFKTENRFLVDYAFGGFAGAGINTTDNNESKDFSARLLLHPLKNLDLGGSYYNGFDKWGTPTAKEHVRSRYAAEFSYTYSVFTLKGEYLQGTDGAFNRGGWYGQISSFVYKNNIQLVAKYDTYDPNIARETVGDITTNYTAGVNLYFNEWAKLQINYTNRVEEKKQVNNDIIAAQLQISF